MLEQYFYCKHGVTLNEISLTSLRQSKLYSNHKMGDSIMIIGTEIWCNKSCLLLFTADGHKLQTLPMATAEMEYINHLNPHDASKHRLAYLKNDFILYT